ncbi:nucleic-acid-binding protein from mobile element jockey [Plakobranchus ocellatus]|uniref:Nucleic-acid-binding protein from mobile element jockey n=1 Tax=Plakobranchus ocellatus TaxID=259542 RepID=A0AAV4DCS9_9GAST|nr:nucleic-acid-binding protein from mobile element jockey [Plakobranchus ocellatus]
MRCYKCQRYGHGKDRCKKPAAVCVRCGKGGHVERDCSADPHCVNCRGDHAASSKTCPKFLKEQAILRYKAENGGTFPQAHKAVVLEIHKTISTRTFVSAVKSQLRMKPAVLHKDGGRSSPSAPPEGKKAQDSPAHNPQGAAETEYQPIARPKSRQDGTPRKTLNCFAPLAMDAEDTISSIWGDSSTPQLPEGFRFPYGVPSLPFQTPITFQIPPPAPGGETPRSSAFLLASLPLHHRDPCDGGGEATQENQRLGRPAKGWPAKQKIVCGNGYRGPMEHSRF